MGHSFCAGDTSIPRLTPLIQPATIATAEVPSPMTTPTTAYHPPKRKVRSSGFAHGGAELDIYEFAATREQTALREFLRWETPTAINDSLLERKDSKRMKKALLGGLFQKGRNSGVKGVTVGRKTSDGKRYFQIVVDEVEMERQRKERDQGVQQPKNGEMAAGNGKKEEERKGEGPPAENYLGQVRGKMDTHHPAAATAGQRLINGDAHPTTRDPASKAGWKPKTRDKGKTKENIHPGEDSPAAGTFRLLPKPDIGSTGRDLASEGSGILARFGVAADTKNDSDGRGPDTRGFAQGETIERQRLPNGVRNENSNHVRILKSQTSGFVSTGNNLWSMPGLSKTKTEHSAPSPASKPWSKAAAPVQPEVQDSVQDLKSRLSTKPDVQRTLQCSQDGPTGSLPKNIAPTTPQHSAQSSITQTWPTDVLLVTPQHSAHNSLETKKSPCSTSKHSRAASTFSTHGSSVDDGQSEVGSVEIMNAQSAEIVRAPGVAGFYARGTAKLPKPGPAPTRALPSLPEGHDGPGAMLGRANGGNQSRTGAEPALERSPIKVPPSSPTGKYRYSPCKSPAPKLLTMPVEPDGTAETRRMLSDSSPTLSGSTPAVHARRKCSLGGEMNAAMLEQAQLQRVRSTNALKGRDLQRHYSNQTDVEVDQPRPQNKTEAKTQDVSLLSSARYSPGIPTHPNIKETVNVNHTETGPSSGPEPSDQRTACKVSPIILVSEQIPTINFPSPGRKNNITNGLEILEKGGIRHTAQNDPNKPLEATSGSEDKEQLQRENPGMIPEAWPNLRAKSGGSIDTTNHVSISDQHSFTNTKDHESKLEARISALERKNTILLRVVMAVLDESGNIGGLSGGDRSSGLSSTSSLYGSRESRLEAKFDAVLSFLQENKRLSTE